MNVAVEGFKMSPYQHREGTVNQLFIVHQSFHFKLPKNLTAVSCTSCECIYFQAFADQVERERMLEVHSNCAQMNYSLPGKQPHDVRLVCCMWLLH